VGKIVFNIHYGGNLFDTGLFLLLSMAMLYAVGFAVGGLASTIRTAQTAGMTLFFIMFFSSGAAIPRSEFPEWLQHVTDYIPLSHVVDVLDDLWVGKRLIHYMDSTILILAILVVALIVAKWKFRWESVS
ncbi:MAG: ABC transporter permease, partial [Alicyclobacillus shizuokensis]|nr:ABC transporter permease [Alicyclobacillus shizuokensis]